MMGRQSGQLSMMVMDLSELIPNNHLLRRISQVISFDFIYEILEPYYPSNGRPSFDPVSMFKMLLVGYLYGIKSERRLVQEIQLNIAYRWFCGFELADKIPDHSTFSKTRLRKWNESQLFQQVFLEIVRRCVKSGLVDGKELAADGTYLPANVSRDSWIETEVEAELSMQSYLDRLDEELSKQPGFKKPSIKTIKKRRTTSKTDPDSGCINHGKKSGIGYLMETTVDCKCGIITGVDVYPANEKESLLVLRHLERQIQNGVPMQNIALDRGYDTGAVHRGLELLGITGYIPAIQFSNSPEKYGFVYLPQEDAFWNSQENRTPMSKTLSGKRVISEASPFDQWREVQFIGSVAPAAVVVGLDPVEYDLANLIPLHGGALEPVDQFLLQRCEKTLHARVVKAAMRAAHALPDGTEPGEHRPVLLAGVLAAVVGVQYQPLLITIA